ncbi:hypothetical protein CMI46_03180 [Candidatus Pacearchaeota archaeon]|nr:hypothetical protein [Candidatus Pacearchaeota archaeon]|tara:strand:- start:1360 stop:2379 length:1020 start_codon:yes stop_codon:yes gene_type:complete
MVNKKLWLSIALVAGTILFIYFLINFGITSLDLIKNNFNFYYLGLYIFFTLFAFVPITWRLQAILKGYGKKPRFLILLKQTIAAYSLSYITPAVRLGGEPLRAYMLKKECDIDLKTGSSAIILDKFVEFFGSAMLGIVGLVTIIMIPGFTLELKILFSSILLAAILLVLIFYIRTINSKGSFSTLLNLARLSKIKKWKNFNKAVIDVENLMKDFFSNHKKELFSAGFFYLINGIVFFLEIKYLLLSIGIETSMIDLILIINIWGLVNFIPVPGAIGFLEAGQTTLFQVLQGDGTIGFAMALIIRARSLFVIMLGFFLITQFSGSQIIKEFKEKTKKQDV